MTMRTQPLFLEEAASIGRRLCADAIWDGDCCTWFTWCTPGDPATAALVLRTCGPGFLDGTQGIGRFLWLLGEVVPERQIRRTAAGAARHASIVPDEDKPEPATSDVRPEEKRDPRAALEELRRGLHAVENLQVECPEELGRPARALVDHLRTDPAAMSFPSTMADGWCGFGDALLWYEPYEPGNAGRDAIETVAVAALQRHARGFPWRCGGAAGVETPDLRHGLAGIGWLYLRLAVAGVPSPFALPDAWVD